jgi:putative transposase
VGPVEIDVPRDRVGSLEPQIVKKRQRRLTGVDEMVLPQIAGRFERLDESAADGRSGRLSGGPGLID